MCGVAWLCKALAHLCLGEKMEGCQPRPGNQAEKPGGAGGAAPTLAYLGEAPPARWVPRGSASFTLLPSIYRTQALGLGPDRQTVENPQLERSQGGSPHGPSGPAGRVRSWGAGELSWPSHTAGASLGSALAYVGRICWGTKRLISVLARPLSRLWLPTGLREPCRPGLGLPHPLHTSAAPEGWGWEATQATPSLAAWASGLGGPGSYQVMWVSGSRGQKEPC